VPEKPKTRSRIWLAALAIFVVALALRLAHLWALRSSYAGSDMFSLTLVDAAHHWKEALAILDGHSPLSDGVPWKGPGYSYFLAGLAALFGRSAGALRWPLALLGSINCALLVLLARRILDLRWAAAAGLLAALNGLLIVYDTELYHPTLLISLSLATFLLLAPEGCNPLRFLGAGLLLGLACLVHPAYLLPAGLLAAWACRRGWKHAAALAAGTALMIMPVTLCNVAVHGEPVLISWNGGANIYVGNHPTFDQRAGNSTQAWGRILRAPVDAGIESEAARDRLYYRLAARRALQYPAATLGVLMKKVAVFFSPVEYSSNFRIYDLRERSPLAALLLAGWGPIRLPFGLWAGAALIGLFSLLSRKSPLCQALALWALGVMLANVLVFNTARYRAPVVFLGSIWVAAALAAAWRYWKAGRLRHAAAIGAAYAAITGLLAFNAVPQQDLPPPIEWHQAAALASEGAIDEASGWVERAVARDPQSPALLLFAAGFHDRPGDRERQRGYLHRLLDLPGLEPDTIDAAHERMAASYFAQRRFDESRTELFEALAVGVDDAEWRGYPHYALGVGPVRRCLLQLRLADVEMRRGANPVARGILDSVREECPLSRRIRGELELLESRLQN
jgi:hypothetical protein